jgi:hypothetical protein
MTPDATHFCLKEQDWGRLWEILKRHTAHVVDGDSDGGFRDRLLLSEKAVEDNRRELKEAIEAINKKIEAVGRGRYVIGIISGGVGALLALGMKDVLIIFIKWLMGSPCP